MDTTKSDAIKRWKLSLLDFFFPRACSVCKRRLALEEQYVCMKCRRNLPYTRYNGRRGNPVEKLFWGILPIERATSYFYYQKDAISTCIVKDLKYHTTPGIGEFFGRVMAAELISTDFFDGIDGIIPLPLNESKYRERGYNQSEQIANGLSAITNIPVMNNVVTRPIKNPTQTELNAAERRENVKNIFDVPSPEAYKNKHFLLVDDVITTGASLISCGSVMTKKIGGLRISILTLTAAGQIHSMT